MCILPRKGEPDKTAQSSLAAHEVLCLRGLGRRGQVEGMLESPEQGTTNDEAGRPTAQSFGGGLTHRKPR